MKKRLLSLLQLAIGVGIILFLVLRMQRSGTLDHLFVALRAAAENWPLLVVAFAGFGVCMFFCTVRWNYLLEAQDLRLPFSRVATLTLIGQFFSAFMLGATGGDFVKAYYVARETSHKRTEVISTIFIDRVIGMLGLILLAAVVTLVRMPFFLRQPQTRIAMAVNLAFLAAAAVGLFLTFRKNLFERWAFFRTIEERTALGAVLRRAYDAFRICFSHRGVFLRTLLLSVGNHVMLIVSCYYVSMALRLTLTFVDVLTVFPLINAIACIPITPGGLGTRESAAIYMLGVLHVPDAAAMTLSLILYACMTGWSLVGGVVYLAYSAQRGRVADAAADRE